MTKNHAPLTSIADTGKPRPSRIHYVFRHNDDGTRTYWCGKVSGDRALRGGTPGTPRCRECEELWALNKDLHATVHPSTRTALAVLNALDCGESAK